jgi:hypothetical protein
MQPRPRQNDICSTSALNPYKYPSEPEATHQTIKHFKNKNLRFSSQILVWGSWAVTELKVRFKSFYKISRSQGKQWI